MGAVATAKAYGIHYTPSALATFLARRALAAPGMTSESLRVLDPASGDGELLAAVAALRPDAHLYGVDRDEAAIATARANLADAGAAGTNFLVADFLDLTPDVVKTSFGVASFDLVITNPPYVRTQHLGAERAQELSARFGLSGRVDLYQVFAHHLVTFLRPAGILGLLCSNRFLSVQAGRALRSLLTSELAVREIVDLGDSKLFAAAVLPAVVIAERPASHSPSQSDRTFVRVYERTNAAVAQLNSDLLDAVERGIEGAVTVAGRTYEIERGRLRTGATPATPWMLSHDSRGRWLETIEANTRTTFEALGKIRVGIKTTADAVFIRGQWDDLALTAPESELLRPLLTHHVADRWRAASPTRTVLYPHVSDERGRQQAINLDDFPRAAAYLLSHYERLAGRKYVIESGRKWFEVWVPQDPSAWASTKIVWPDISEAPRFFLDQTGAVVNGDCYWIAFDEGTRRETISLMLAVANSTFALAFYDVVCGNRLYSGRRRFITQYVKRFPVPTVDDATLQSIHDLVSQLLAHDAEDPALVEATLDAMIWRAFGLEVPQAT